MKDYDTSKDYHLLWKLIKKNHKIPAYVHYSEDDEPIYFLVEVKRNRDDIERAYGFSGEFLSSFRRNFIEFKKICQNFNLDYIIPNSAKFKFPSR